MKNIVIVILFILISISLYELYGYVSKPTITFETISSDSIVSMKDTLIIKVKFYDWNGDIGDSIKSESQIVVADEGYNVVRELPVILNPTEGKYPVEGTLKILLDFLPILDSATDRKTTIKIYITDKNGHRSNNIETPELVISKIKNSE